MASDKENLTARDSRCVWHPYSSIIHSPPVFPVMSADGVYLHLESGDRLIDGMSSWWCAIHGYNHPVLNAALTAQMNTMSHVMFGGLTHAPAVDLAEKLVSITPGALQAVFFSDSGSVSVEVAIKMAIQYWQMKKCPQKQKLLTIKKGYHGDTFEAMSVCDPVTGMHSLFQGVLSTHYFAERPEIRFNEAWDEQDISSFKTLLENHHNTIAAVILEPVVQGAGGMWFYSPDYLARVRELCNEYNVLLILDEIATGFCRSGKLFACEHADISADIMCLGKSLTGGYLTLAATLTTRHVAEIISDEGRGIFMHGPTYMANPLACAVANASIDLLLSQDWLARVSEIEVQLRQGLEPCRQFEHVVDVRVLGAIGVVELDAPVDMHTISAAFVKRGVWIRPFGRLIYLMPPYIIEAEQLNALTNAVHGVINEL